MIDRSKDSVSMTDFLYEEAKLNNEKREAESSKNYFQFLSNGLMLSASTIFAVLVRYFLEEPFSIGLFLGRFGLMLLGLALVRGFFRAFLGKDAEKGNLSPAWYLVFVFLPAVFLLFSK